MSMLQYDGVCGQGRWRMGWVGLGGKEFGRGPSVSVESVLLCTARCAQLNCYTFTTFILLQHK